MPEDSKKNHEKRRDPKEQRRSRRTRHEPGPVEKKHDNVEEPKPAPKAPQPPVYESPGPEFYKNLKRETDDILKITEEESAKYKKKEIQSNWTKYEMPIESYEEIDEQENLGADYEKLIQAPLSIGGHFQFKHEKSWDINTGPSLYDKYFEINMDNLSLALSTIPFYERNTITDQSIFNESDILCMNNRATRYKQKYFNDKSYNTPESEAQEKILNNLKENLSTPENKHNKEILLLDDTDKIQNKECDIKSAEDNELVLQTKDIGLDFINIMKADTVPRPVVSNVDIIEEKKMASNLPATVADTVVDDIDDIILGYIEPIAQIKEFAVEIKKVESELVKKVTTEKSIEESVEIITIENKVTSEDATKPPEPKTNPVIESPEDLEKWLDDFLDG